MSSTQRVRVALIGTSPRAVYMFGPVLRGLAGDVEIVSVWGRSEGSAKRVGEALGVPWYLDIEKLKRETAPEIGIVNVSYGANGQVGLMAVEAGLHVLLETPIAHDLKEADAILTAAAERNRKVEVAEQFHRRPLEQIKLKLIESGLFGRVHSSFSDFAGHGYHGISVMRSYLGFDAQPVRVSGAVQQYPLAPHWARLADKRDARTETQEHGIIEFSSGQIGIFHWTDVGYDSPLRWWRSSRFLAEKGMGITISRGLEVQEWLTLLTPDGEAPAFITLERRWERVDGGRLEAIIAHTGDPALPLVRWDNPFRLPNSGYEPQWHDDEIGVAGCIMSLVNAVRSGGEPTYGGHQARLDQALILAIRQSAAEGGRPIALPL
ncbi:MAG: Gfo/Idh/MocA family oxidoreductase [Anaerolineae bacterium]